MAVCTNQECIQEFETAGRHPMKDMDTTLFGKATNQGSHQLLVDGEIKKRCATHWKGKKVPALAADVVRLIPITFLKLKIALLNMLLVIDVVNMDILVVCYSKFHSNYKIKGYLDSKSKTNSKTENKIKRDKFRIIQFKDRKQSAANLPFYSIDNSELGKILDTKSRIKAEIEKIQSKFIDLNEREQKFDNIVEENFKLKEELHKFKTLLADKEREFEYKVEENEFKRCCLASEEYHLEKKLDANILAEQNLLSQIQGLQKNETSLKCELIQLRSDNDRLRSERNDLREREHSLIGDIQELNHQLITSRNTSQNHYHSNSNQCNGQRRKYYR